MYQKISDICDKNILKCNANLALSNLLALIDDQKTLPFVLLEEDNKLVGLLTPKHINFALTYYECFKTTICKDFICLSIKRAHISLNLRDALEDMTACKIDSYVVMNENHVDIGIVTMQTLLEYILKETPSELSMIEKNVLSHDSKLNRYLNDIDLFNSFKVAQIKNNFKTGPIGPLIVYEPEKPISILLPYNEILTMIKKAFVKDCNTIYEQTYQISKHELIGKQSASDLLPDNTTNQVMLQQVIENNYRGYNIESHEQDRFGNSLWFLNNVLYESVNNEIIRFWISKQDITFRKNLERSSWRDHEQFNEMFKSSLDSIFIIDVLPNNTYRFSQVNPACEKDIGLTNDKIVKMNITDIFPGEIGIKMTTALNDCLQENQSIHIENEFDFPAGKSYYYTTLVPIRSEEGDIVQIIGVAVNITDKKKEEEDIRHLNWSLLALSNGNSAISRATSEIELIQTCCQSITNENEYFPLSGVLEVTNDPKLPLKIHTLSGSGLIYIDDELNFNKLLGQKCILDSVFSKKAEIQNIAPDKEQKFNFSSKDAKKEYSIRSVLTLPLLLHEKVIFLLVIYSNQPNSFVGSEVRMFEELGHNMILGIEHKRTQSNYEKSVMIREEQAIKLSKSFGKTLGALGSMLEHRDPYTAGHQKRVADLSAAIAKVYGLEPARIQLLYLAATVHDIGKVTIPSEILSKPTKLNPVEFAMIKVHPEAGYQVLKDIDFPGPLADIVRQHHEYLDGSGYPLGLKGDEILLESKILTVADIVEAISSHRPYRPGLGIDFALNEIKKMSGIKLDAKAVTICINLFKRDAYAFPNVDSFNHISALHQGDISRSLRVNSILSNHNQKS